MVLGGYAMDALKKAKQGLSFERWLLYPAGTGAFFLFNLGRLRGGRAEKNKARLVLREMAFVPCGYRGFSLF